MTPPSKIHPSNGSISVAERNKVTVQKLSPMPKSCLSIGVGSPFPIVAKNEGLCWDYTSKDVTLEPGDKKNWEGGFLPTYPSHSITISSSTFVLFGTMEKHHDASLMHYADVRCPAHICPQSNAATHGFGHQNESRPQLVTR